MAQYKGTVKWFNNAKGYGFLGPRRRRRTCSFITAPSSGRLQSLKEGDPVEFDIIQGDQGPAGGPGHPHWKSRMTTPNRI